MFTIAIAAIMAFMTAFSTADWTEIAIIGAIAIAAIAAFVVQERRSPEPMISLDLWGRRPIAAVNASSLFAGMVIIGLTTFLPVFVQGVMGRPPLTAGFALSAMVMGWPLGATLSARLWKRFGVRNVLRAGATLIPLGALAFVFLQAETPPVVAGIGSAVVGFGMGLSSSASIVLIQEIVDWSERGSVTAAYLFARTPRQHVRRDRVRLGAERRAPARGARRRHVRTSCASCSTAARRRETGFSRRRSTARCE